MSQSRKLGVKNVLKGRNFDLSPRNRGCTVILVSQQEVKNNMFIEGLLCACHYRPTFGVSVCHQPVTDRWSKFREKTAKFRERKTNIKRQKELKFRQKEAEISKNLFFPFNKYIY